MKKIHMMIAALLVFLPTMLFAGSGWGTTTYYYAALKTQVSSNSSGMGKVYAGTTTTAGTYSETSSQTDAQSSTTQNANKTFYAFAQAKEGYEFAGWSKSDKGTDLGTTSPLTVTLSCISTTSPNATTYYATFKEKTLAAFGISFETSANGAYTVDGAAPANKTGLTKATKVVLASSDANFLNWNINGTVVNNNPYTTTCTENTTISAEFLSADQVTSVTTISDLTAALSNAAYKKIIVPSGTTLTVAKGSTVTVPAGKQLVVDGILNVLGTVLNSGVISGSGKLYKISYLIDQGENELQVLCGPDGTEYGKISNTTYHSGESSRYYKTKVASNTPSVNGTVNVSTTSWGAILNGKDVYAISAQTLKGVQVSLDNTVAANKISGIVGSLTTTDISSGETSGKKNWLLFADCNLKGPVRSGETTRLNFNGTIDLGGHKLTFGQPRTYSDFYGMFLNGTIDFQPSTDFQNGGAIFFNCALITVKKIKGTPTMLFYDCGTSSSASTLTFSYQSGAHRNARFYNGYYSYSFNTSYDSSYAKVYGGSFSSDPSSYLADIDKLEAVKSGNYYIVQEKKEVVNVVQIGSTPYESLDAAISAAANGSTISLIEAVELTGTTTIPADKSITIAIDGHKLTGGKIVNNGTLVFTDSTTGKGTTASEASDGLVESDIENNGTLDFVFGRYSGAIVNKAGTLTTHNGLFTGTLDKQGGTVNLKGGHFSADVEALATVQGTKVFSGSSLNSVCELPNGTMYSDSLSDAAGYGVTPYSDDDFALVKGWFVNKNTRTSYTAAEWTRLAELLCFYQLFNNNGLDATLAFDRDVSKGALNLYAKSQLTLSVDLKFDLAAGQYYRALSETLIGNGYYAKTYKALWDDNIKSVAMAATDKTGDNAGTVCTAMIELWTDVRDADYGHNGLKHTNTVFIAAEKRFTIGAGSDKAMIRPEVGAATFYATVSDAVAAAADGATVMLTQDCEEDVVLAKAGSFTIDQNGFVLTGTVTAGGDYFIEKDEDGTYTVAKKGIVDENGNAQASIQDVVNAAVESEAAEVTITIPETTSEQIVALPEDKTLIIVQAEGSETVVNVTPPEGHFVEATVVEPVAGESQGGTTTVYETKKITEAVVTVTEESVQELSVKLEEVQSGSTETNAVEEVAKIVEAVNNLMENKALERADNVVQAKDETVNLKAIVITPKVIVQEVQGAATESEKVVKAAAFDVTPTDTNDNKIENTSFTFRLPVADGMTGSMVVFHEKVFFGVYPILAWSDGAKLHKYIEITSSEFSEYSYEPRRGVEYAVAKIGDVGYDSLEDAVAAAAAGAKVELLMSTTLTNEIAVAKAVTLDLGEYTVTAANGKNAIQVAAGGNLTIEATTGGIAAASGFAVYTDYELSQGVKSVTINGGVFDGALQFNKYPLQTSAAQSGESATPTTVAINGGTFNGNVKIYRCPTTIAGGTFEQGLDTSSSSVSVYSNSKTPVRVIGGKFKTEPVSVGNRVFVNAGYYDDGYFVVGDTSVCQAKRNGKFYRSVAEAFAAVGADTRIEILNGADVSGINVTLGEGQSLTVPSSFTAVAAANGYTLHTDVNTADGTVTYTAYVDGAVARIGGQHYASLDAAFEAAQDGDTITLVADATLGATAISAEVTLALAEHSVNVATAGINLTGKLTVTGVGLVSAVPSITGNGELVILGGTWKADPSAFVPQVVTALPGEQDDKAWTKDRCYVFANKAFVDGGWGDAEGFYTVVPLPKAYVTTMSEKPEVGGYGALDCAYTFESFSSANGDDAIAAKFLEGGFSAFSDPVELARAKELLMEKMPFLDWNADFVVSLDGAADAGDLMLSGHYAQWDIGWVSYESPNTIDANQKVRLLVDIGQATPGDWPYENICRYVRTFDCGAKKLKSAMDGKTMTVQLRLYKPGEDEGLGSPSILICEYKYTFGGYAAKIVRSNETLRYATLAETFAAVQANETIQLLNDYTGAADLSGCEASFTLDKNGFGLAITGEPTTGEDWFFEKMSNDNWFHYYKKPATEEAPVVTVEVVDEDGETMSLSTLTPDADWLDGKVQEGETAEEALAKVEENGLQAWQNYVIGQNPTAAVRVDTEQAPINNTPVANTLTEKVNVPADSGFTVTYELDKIEVDGTVVEGTPQSTAENFNIDLEAATDNESGAAYFKMTAVIEATDGTGAKTKVASENTIGVLKVESSAKSTVIAVPWESLAADGQDITVSDLVRTATLTEGDELKVYDTATGKYRAWTLNGSKEWAPIPVVGGASSEEAGDSTIARGSGVWLTRTDTTQPIYLVGEVAEQSTTTTIAGANEEKPTWNLVAAPTVESVDLNEKFPDANEGDVVLVPTDGAPKRYTYKDGSWGYDDYVTTVNKKGIEVVKVVRNTNVTNVPIGTGFWYMNAGDAKNVEW